MLLPDSEDRDVPRAIVGPLAATVSFDVGRLGNPNNIGGLTSTFETV